MSRFDRRLSRTPTQRGARGKLKGAMSVQQALEWAFGVEKGNRPIVAAVDQAALI